MVGVVRRLVIVAASALTAASLGVVATGDARAGSDSTDQGPAISTVVPSVDPPPGQVPCGGGEVVRTPPMPTLVPGVTIVTTYCAWAPDIVVDGHVLHAVVVPPVDWPPADFSSGPSQG